MKKIIIAACMALLGCGSVFAQQGKQAIGGNLSYGTEIESVGIGLKYQYNITDQIRIEPSMNYFFKNDGLSMFDINANIHYLFPIASNISLYPLYNPQNEMFRLLGTKRSFSQNETFFFSHPYPALFRLISHF